MDTKKIEERILRLKHELLKPFHSQEVKDLIKKEISSLQMILQKRGLEVERKF